MAVLRENGNITAKCPGCRGALSTYEYKSAGQGDHGAVKKEYHRHRGPTVGHMYIQYRLYRCAGCGQGGIGAISLESRDFPGRAMQLEWFEPKSIEYLEIPDSTPDGIKKEFREAERCIGSGCYRAASCLFRSVLDKTMRANGFKTSTENNLYSQIEAASEDEIITQARKKRAHDEVRVLGNNVLHDEWYEIDKKDVELTHHYTQRILEDFYDDRATVKKLLIEKERLEKPSEN